MYAEVFHLHDTRIFIEDLECTIMHTGEPTIDECLEAVRNQTYRPSKIRMIENVSPLNESINERHRSLKLPFSVKVDADMILYPDCFKTLYKAIKGSSARCWGVSARLLDPFIGEMGGVHIQRSDLIRDIKVPNIIGCDRWLMKEMQKKGYLHKEIPRVLGTHKCDWSLENIFKRHVKLGQKQAYHKNTKYEDIVERMKDNWERGNKKIFLALIGYSYGLLVPSVVERDEHFMAEEWERIKELIESKVILVK